MSSKITVLVTGAAGFIGYHLCNHLIKLGHNVVGLDNINDYYDVNQTWADVSKLQTDYDYKPKTPVDMVVEVFIKWY
jgi:UDP-glucuronate 4-epimerase